MRLHTFMESGNETVHSINIYTCTHMQGGVKRLAEIIVGFALGLDLSTLAAVASGQFATAHEKLGRNRPTHGLKDEHLDREFFAMVLGSRGRFMDWSRWSVSDQVTWRGGNAMRRKEMYLIFISQDCVMMSLYLK